MKKLFVIVAILLLVAGVSSAASLNDGETRQVWAQNRGNSVVSESAVVMTIWYDGAGASPAVGVSGNCILRLYSDIAGGNIELLFDGTASTAWDTVGEVVTSINSVSGWHAVVGPDSYPGASTLREYLAENFKVPGSNKAGAVTVLQDTSCSVNGLTCGVSPEENKIARIKQVITKVGGENYGQENYIMKIYDGSTLVWREDIAALDYDAADRAKSSPRTVVFSDDGSKGLASAMGNGLCVVVSRSSVDRLGDTSHKLPSCNASIIYDQF